MSLSANGHIVRQIQKLDNGCIVESVPDSVFDHPIICQRIVTKEIITKMTQSEMMSVIHEKHGIMFHRLSDTCVACGNYCEDNEIIIRNCSGIMSASCCGKEECEIITCALLLGGNGLVQLYDEQHVSNVKVKRSSGQVENDWKILYFDTNKMYVVVGNTDNILIKGIPVNDFHFLNPTIRFDLRLSPIDIIERARTLSTETNTCAMKMFLFPNV